MPGWFRADAALASCSKRARRSRSWAKSSGRTFTATSRPRRESRARYTSPIPPAPSGERISYGPIRSLGESGMKCGNSTGIPRRAAGESALAGLRWRDPVRLAHFSELADRLAEHGDRRGNLASVELHLRLAV